MSGNRAANQILAIVLMGVIAVWILRFVGCTSGVGTAVFTHSDGTQVDGHGVASEKMVGGVDDWVHEEAPEVDSTRVVGAYYPDAEPEDPGFLASADPLVLAGVGGLATFGAVGSVALLVFGFRRERTGAGVGVSESPALQPAMARGAAGGTGYASGGGGTAFEEPEFDEWGRPSDYVEPASQGIPQGCVWAVGIGLFLVVIIGPLPIAFILGLILEG